MATVQIYHDESDRLYTVTVNIKRAQLYPVSLSAVWDDPPSAGSELNKGANDALALGDEYYLELRTTIPTVTGGIFPIVLLKDLSGAYAAPGAGAAANWQELVNDWIDYFMSTATLGMSSSSSTGGFSSSSSSTSTT